jgi:hypothetical protein
MSEPVILLCSWCQYYGLRDGAVRPLSGRDWVRVSHAFVVAAAMAGLASHGICPACAPQFAVDLGVAGVVRRAARPVARAA